MTTAATRNWQLKYKIKLYASYQGLHYQTVLYSNVEASGRQLLLAAKSWHQQNFFLLIIRK